MMDANVIRTGLFEIQMCCSGDCTDDFIKSEAASQNGGTWELAYLGDRTHVPCDYDPSSFHVVLKLLSSSSDW